MEIITSTEIQDLVYSLTQVQEERQELIKLARGMLLGDFSSTFELGKAWAGHTHTGFTLVKTKSDLFLAINKTQGYNLWNTISFFQRDWQISIQLIDDLVTNRRTT